MIPIHLLTPDGAGLTMLWKKFDAHRASFADDLPDDPIHFVCWLSATDVRVFLVGEDPTEPIGVFIFTGIVQDEAAWTHVFIWDQDAASFKDLIESAQATCISMFKAYNLHRINGLTPVTNVPARVFAEKVGFKIEGRLVEAMMDKGLRTDAWISGLLLKYLPSTPT